MNSEKSRQILNWVMQDKIPSNLKLTERVMKEAAHSARKITTPRMKFATSLVIALVALILLSSVVYAVYYLIIDPGLRSVQDAGLVTNMDTTALPTILPTVQPTVPPSALITAQSQTVEGVTMTLDWVYFDSTRMLFGIHFSELPADISIGFPQVELNGQPLGGDQQPSIYLRSTNSQAIYVSTQVTQSSLVEDAVNLEMAIPLLRSENEAETQVAVIEFFLEDVPLYAGQTLGFQQTIAVSVNGIEMQLHSVRQTPSAVEAVVCPSPTSSAVFSVQQALLSTDGISERPSTSIRPVEDQGTSCQKVSFDPQGDDGRKGFTLTVNKDWIFNIDQPSEDQIPGVGNVTLLPTPQVVDAQSIDQVTMTLDWVFVDAKRIAFGYTITGLPELPEAALLGGTIDVSDAQGNQYGSGYGGFSTVKRSIEQPGALKGTWSTILQKPLTVDQINMSIDVTLDGTHGNDWNYIIGNIIDPSSDPTDETVGSMPVVIPANLVGTYHFEVATNVYPATILQPGQVMETNGIQMELVQAELTPSHSSFMLCYNKPSAEDWTISSEAVLLSGVEQASINGYALLSDTHFVMKNPVTLPHTSITGENMRCVQIEFMLGHANQERTITLTIPGLERSVPEGFSQAELDSALAKLRELGIEMNYSISRGVGGGGGGPEFTKLPEGMTQNEAYNRYMDVLGYRLPGAWVFTLKYQP